jgi:Fe2+ transport system protein FeoA
LTLDLILRYAGMRPIHSAIHDPATAEPRLVDITLREVVELVRIDLPTDQMEPLLERGLLPGCQLCQVRRSPSGDPIVMVDGTLLAIRREVARCLCVRRTGSNGA